MELVLYFASILIFSFIIFIIGNYIASYLKIENNNYQISNFAEYGLYGIIFVSFSALLLNFFTKLSPEINFYFFIISFLIALFFIKKKTKVIIKTIKYSFICALITGVTLMFDNVNTPDAGVYHLPYVSILNIDKISIGINNIQHRYGFISILQYLSAISNNILFSINGITISLCSLFSILIILFFNEFKKEKNNLLKFLSSIFLIFSLYEFNRFSGHGNDELSFMIYFLCTLYFFKTIIYKNENYKKLILLISFSIALKTMLIFVIFLPIFIYLILKPKLKWFFNKVVFFSFLFVLLWFIKNFLTTSCLLYPAVITCSENITWSNSKKINPSNPEKVSKSTEGAAKAWIDWHKNNPEYKGTVYTYLNDVNWVKVWFKNHFPIILKSLLILNLIIIFFIYAYKNIYDEKLKKAINLILIYNLILSLIWFIKFPLYRFGSGYIVTLNIFCYLFIWNKITFFKDLNIKEPVKKIAMYFFIFVSSSVIIKHSIRIIENFSLSSQFPKITNEEVGVEKKLGDYYYLKKGRCFYTKLPCTSEPTHVKQIKKIYSYKVYIIE